VAEVHLHAGLRDLSGGVSVLEIDAPTVRALIRELDTRFPGLGERLSAGTNVAINGEIIPDAELEPIPEGAEIHFLEAISGG